MNTTWTLYLTLFLLLSGILILARSLKTRNRYTWNNQKDIANWMRMSYKDRLKQDENHKKIVAQRKRLLVEQIRKEYKRVTSKK